MYCLMEMTTFNDLKDVESWVAQMLTRGAADAKSAFHWPVLCTMGEEPHGRVVVLRAFDKRNWLLLFYTDKRSEKVAHIQTTGVAECVFFDARKMVQMRTQGRAYIAHAGTDVAEHFAAIRPEQQKDYGSSLGPGSSLMGQDLTYDKQAAEQNFCLVKLHIEAIDWLNLSRSGHQRARLNMGGEHVWLVP